jgi:hypothetical protein
LILNRAGRIAWRNGTKVIELTKNNETELLYRKTDQGSGLNI